MSSIVLIFEKKRTRKHHAVFALWSHLCDHRIDDRAHRRFRSVLSGGKTVVLKSLGLAALLVKAGIPVPVAPGSSPRVDYFDTVRLHPPAHPLTNDHRCL
jgi:hypothetical protein